MKIKILTASMLALSLSSYAQYAWQEVDRAGKLDLTDNINYTLEVQTSISDGTTPLWLNANKYGLSSLDKRNGYERVSLIRPMQTDSARRWAIGYGVDVAVAQNYTSTFVVQQAFAEVRWLHGALTIGSKQRPMELKNSLLSSGSQTFGINARPVPQIRLSLPEYWVLPILHNKLRFKGHIAYGKMTDDNWQHEFTGRKSKYADDVMYHSKAGYLMIGNPDAFQPLTLELGLEMASQYGGTSHIFDADGRETIIKGKAGLSEMIKALIPGGSDAPEKGTVYQNMAGNHLGSWLARVNYDNEDWKISLYADKFFEDQSAMFQVDYDGYGKGDEWDKWKKRKFLLYDFSDWLLGIELDLKYNRWIRGIAIEYINSKYQSGPIYHDHSQTNQIHIGGNDNYYNHHIYTGWQHWGQAIGNPLYRSPIYNEDGTIYFADNRFKAFHIGLMGVPSDHFSYRALATYQEGFGTYDKPFTKKQRNISFMVEATYHFPGDWHAVAAYGMDFGKLLGDNAGFQLTVRKTGILKDGIFKKK